MHQRGTFHTPTAYYGHLFYWMGKEEGWAGILRAIRHAEQCHIPFEVPVALHDTLLTFRRDLDATQQEAVVMRAVTQM